MKCDHLIGRTFDGDVYILASDVMEAIAELKEFAEDACIERDDNQTAIDELQAENAELKKKLMPCLNGDCILTCEVVEKYGKENTQLKQKLESVQASMYADVVDVNMENRRLRRALYKACANWADIVAFEETEGIGHDNSVAERWRKMERKCLKKAEEYK